MAETTAFGRRVSPSSVVTVQDLAASSYSMETTCLPYLMCGVMPYLAAQARRYAWISSCGENIRDQPGFSSNEYEYMCDGTSQAQPG
ncbi:hypothetical protein GCM10020220_011900 [Nonomuraea rubra]